MVSRLVKLLALLFALTACEGSVIFSGSASSPDPLVIPSTLSTPTTIELTPAPGAEDYHWDAVTISDLNALRNGPVTFEVLDTLTNSCVDSVVAFTRMGQALLGDVDRVLDVGVAAENGTGSIADASTAFDVWGNTALVVGYMAIHVVDNASFPPDAVSFIDQFGEVARKAGGYAFAIGNQAFIAADGEIDETKLEIWREHGLHDDALDELIAATDSVDSEALCR
ncbi:MAG TPA: hypothetical protein VI193_01120 [Acidimicrobiia bacterium]